MIRKASTEGMYIVKYQSFIFNGSSVMAKVKVFRNVGQTDKGRGQGHKVIDLGVI